LKPTRAQKFLLGKIQKDSIGKVRKPNFVITSSSASTAAAAAVPTSSVLKKIDYKVSKKTKKGQQLNRENILI